MNQCGSFWSPDMTKLLTDRFVIRVKRNVFDHFGVKAKQGHARCGPIRWINATRLHEESVDIAVIDVFFEDLVLNFNQFKEKLLNSCQLILKFHPIIKLQFRLNEHVPKCFATEKLKRYGR